MEYVFLILGFVLLIKGADFFVDGSSSVAKRLKVPSLIIGMTIVAMGTSLPECAVSVSASVTNQNSLAISNAVGSNIFNLMVVCGVCSIFCPLDVKASTLKKEFPFSVFVAAFLLVFGVTGMAVNRLEGGLLLLLFICFILWMIKASKSGEKTEEENITVLPVWKCIVFILGGAAAIALGGDMVVNSASQIARSFGMSETLIGLTIVALGTSLPELVTSITAARKNELDMALGNVIGSNIFNILFVLGIAAAISPLSFTVENIIDIVVLCAMSVLVWLFAWRKKRLIRWQGIVMMICYGVYCAYIFVR